MAELLDDVDGALWNRAMLEECRVHMSLPEMRRVVVAIDPAGGSGKGSDETGIVASGVGRDGRGYVLADASRRYSPDGWARAAAGLYRSLKAGSDRCRTKNYGGDMVASTIRSVDPSLPVRMVHAEPREAGSCGAGCLRSMSSGAFRTLETLAGLEDQLCGWDPASTGSSPDRLMHWFGQSPI